MIDEIWNFFENMDEYVYVSDIETHGLVYMNKKARNTYGFSSVEELCGKKCYETIQKCSAPCANCNNCELQEGKFKELSYYNPIIGKHLMVKNTLQTDGDRRYRVEIAFDVSDEKCCAQEGDSSQNLEAFINEGLRIALQMPTPDRSIAVVLEYLGKALGGDRTYIFEKNEEGGDDNTYEWVSSGVTPEKDNLQKLPPEVCANWYKNFSEKRPIVISNLEDIRESDPLQYGILKNQKIHSLIVVPLYNDRVAIGFYGIDNPTGRSLDYALNMLQIMGHFIVSSLKRRDLVRQLQEMSFCDSLTKLGNRYAMNVYIETWQSGRSMGVVYCDVTGLKMVNDTQGHEAGDRLLINAGECLRKVYGEYSLFRIGGDEFLALCSGINLDGLREREAALKQEMEKDNLVLAVGCSWNPDGTESIDKLMAEAESRMYQDKSEYYKRTGIDRRK